MKRVARIDGDVLRYHSAFACQKNLYHYQGVTYPDYNAFRTSLKEQGLKPKDVEFEKELTLLPESVFPKVCQNLLDMIHEATGADQMLIYLSGDTNFRDEAATVAKYKGNRVQDKPVYWDLACKYWLDRAYKVSENQEADDDMSIDQCAELAFNEEESVICTIDKDLNGVPGLHYDWNKQLRYNVSTHQAEVFFLRQLLTGDSTDNIPGIKGIGEAKAKKYVEMDVPTSISRAYVKAVYKEEHDMERLNEVGQLLHIRRSPDQQWSWDEHKTIYTWPIA